MIHPVHVFMQHHQTRACVVPAFISLPPQMTMLMAPIVISPWPFPMAIRHWGKHAECHHIKGLSHRIGCRYFTKWSESGHGTQGAFRCNDIIIGAMVSQITGVSIVYSTVCSGADQRKHQSSASLAFMREIRRWPLNSPHKRLAMRKMFPFDDIIM